MGCTRPFPSFESFQAGSTAQWNRASLNKRLSRSLSYPLPASVLNSEVCPTYESADTRFGKSLSNGAKGSFIVWTTSALKKQNFVSALVSSPLDLGKVNGQRKARRRLLVNASRNSFDETVDGEMMSIGKLSLSKRDLKIAGGAVIAVTFAVANRVLYKLALVPMKDYPFFLALIITFGYVIVYFSILRIRYQAGIVTDEMLELPKWRFFLVGFLEALGIASGMAAAALLPGAAIPILSQTFLVWQLGFSVIFLKKRYSFGQLMGCAMVLTGVIIALTSSGSASYVDDIGLFWPLLMILSSSFQAGATIIKEFVFQDASQRLKGGSVDIFVVNSFGSGFQALCVLLMLPFLSQLRGIPFSQLPRYMKDGAGCLFNIGTMSTDCNGATLLTFLYVVVNLSFNISLLSLLKMSSAVVSSLATTLAVPLSIYMFTLPLPYVGTPASLPPQFLVGTAVLLGGLASYNFSGQFKKLLKD